MSSSTTRDRGRILTDTGWNKIWTAIRYQLPDKQTLAAIARHTEPANERSIGYLTAETIGKIVKHRRKTDEDSIHKLFTAFGLTLEPKDHVSAHQAKTRPNDPNFVGRQEAIAHLHELVHRNAKVIVIQARGGIGKTTLARKFLSQEFDTVIEFPIAKETKDIASIESLLEEKLRQLGEEPGREFMVSCDRLKRKLQGDRVGILIDNLEPALDSAGRFIEPHRRYVEVLRILADPSVQSTTLITTRERLRESSITVQTYLLKSLAVEAWKEFFERRSLPTDTPALAALHHSYGGNAKAMEIIRGAIAQDFDGDVDAYWQENQDDLFIERDLEDLVKQQFERLRVQHPDAYNLLRRMGCYRYQDVPTVPVEGLFCLMWDVPEKEHKRVVKVLRDRSFIETYTEGYSLHPLIRAEALAALNNSPDFNQSHRNAAQFWVRGISDLLDKERTVKGFEGFYHYIEILDFDRACGIIMCPVTHQCKVLEYLIGGEPFLNASRRLGLFQKSLSAINLVIPHIEKEYALARLYITAANFYLQTGLLSSCINHADCTINLLKDTQDISKWRSKIDDFTQTLPNRNISIDVNRSLQVLKDSAALWQAHSYIYLLDINTARSILKRILDDGHNYENIKIDAELMFSLCNSIQSHNVNIRIINEHLIKLREKDHMLTDWCRGYGFLFAAISLKNVREFALASEICQEAIDFSREIGFRQVEAISLCLLAELYRVGDSYNMSLQYHTKASKIIDSIGSKFDLADSCYQRGLTHRAIGETEKSRHYFEKAIALFTEMDAPKQVKRVRYTLEHEDVRETIYLVE